MTITLTAMRTALIVEARDTVKLMTSFGMIATTTVSDHAQVAKERDCGDTNGFFESPN